MSSPIRLWEQPKLASLILAFAVLSVSGVWLLTRTRPTKFSPEAWKAASAKRTGGEPKNPRKLMVNDVIDHYLTNEIARDSVLSLLGPADLPNPASDTQLWYYVGQDSKFGSLLPPSLYLVLDFSPTGALKGCRIVRSD